MGELGKKKCLPGDCKKVAFLESQQRKKLKTNLQMFNPQPSLHMSSLPEFTLHGYPTKPQTKNLLQTVTILVAPPNTEQKQRKFIPGIIHPYFGL